MVKKILSVIICLVFCFSLGVSAAESGKPEVKLYNANTDTIVVSGKAPAGEGVVVTVLNVGYDKSDLVYENYSTLTEVVAYTGAKTAQADGTYNFYIKLRDNGLNPDFGGDFKVIVTVSGTEYELPFEFYFYAKKLEVIRNFNNPGDLALSSILVDAVKYNSFARNKLWTEGNSEKTLTALLNIQKECEGDQFPEDPEKFYEYLETSLLLSAINMRNSKLLTDNGGYLREELLKKLTEDTVDDYKNCLSADGVSSLNADLISRKYDLISDVSDYFDNELIPYYAIAEYKDSGFGHITGYLEKYESIYEEADFKISAFKKLSKTEKKQIFVKV